MMAFAPPKNIECPKMQIKMSTWTPLNHQVLNNQLFKMKNLIANLWSEDSLQIGDRKTISPYQGPDNEMVFEERKALLGKWFDKWTDSQRRRILTGLLERCSLSQQKFCCRKLQEKIPAEALDFTTKLPRVLSIYIFSFLDPRSLCRCAQTPPKETFIVADVRSLSSSSPEQKQCPSSTFRPSTSLRKKNNLGEKELPPWRSSDKHPTDIIRFNYLDNCNPLQPGQGRKKRNEMIPDFSRQSQDKKNKLQDRARPRKAHFLMSLSSSSPLKVPAWSPQASGGSPALEAATKILMQHLQRHPGLQSFLIQDQSHS
ncbi:F-box only protein 16 isoform X4 [Marmota marmota marmota]|uniref:F-box only protein 16 isoform X4 n=1 Tax=Marmota marmota marmota TaxID=9994 RepID=UPI0020938DCA|nr:F-box only protein 16 isoform X4 [Marmota marmota marmota]